MTNINDLPQEMWDEIIYLTDLDTVLELNNHYAIKKLLKPKNNMAWAIENNNLLLVKYFVEICKIDVNSITYYYDNPIFPLTMASWFNRLKIVEYFIQNGADINMRDKYGYTALMMACTYKENIEVVKYLITNGANLYIRNIDGITALSYTHRCDNIEIVEYLKSIAIEHEKKIESGLGEYIKHE